MDSKKYKTILTKDGYLLNKEKFTKKELDAIKNELTVQPQLSYSIGIKNNLEKFNVYKENEQYLSIPKFYGISRIGFCISGVNCEPPNFKLFLLILLFPSVLFFSLKLSSIKFARESAEFFSKYLALLPSCSKCTEISDSSNFIPSDLASSTVVLQPSNNDGLMSASQFFINAMTSS